MYFSSKTFTCVYPQGTAFLCSGLGLPGSALWGCWSSLRSGLSPGCHRGIARAQGDAEQQRGILHCQGKWWTADWGTQCPGVTLVWSLCPQVLFCHLAPVPLSLLGTHIIWRVGKLKTLQDAAEWGTAERLNPLIWVVSENKPLLLIVTNTGLY